MFKFSAPNAESKKYIRFFNQYFLPVGLPLLLGMGLGPLLALLIVNGVWVFSLPLLFMVPMVILLVRYPFAAILVWIIVNPFFPLEGIYTYVYYVFHRILLLLVLGIVVLSRMLGVHKEEYSPAQLQWVEVFMIAYGVMCIVSILVIGYNQKLLMFLYDRTWVPFVAYGLMRLLNLRVVDLKRLIPIMVILLVAECVIGLISWFVPQLLPSIWVSRLVGERVVGTFTQSEVYGVVLIYCMVFVYHYAMNCSKGFLRILFMMSFGLGLVCIFFTFTRSAWLAGVVVLLGLWFLYPKSTSLLVLTVIPIMVILGGGVLAQEFAHAYDRLNNEGTAQDRIVLANAGKQMFYAKPVIGWGYGQYDRYDWKFIDRVGNVAPTKWTIERGTSHNSFLTILAETGFVGFSLYFFPIIWWFVITIKVLPRLPKSGFWSWRLLVVLWLPIIAQLLTAQTVDYRYFAYPLTLMWLTVGLIASIVLKSLKGDHKIPSLAGEIAPTKIYR